MAISAKSGSIRPRIFRSSEEAAAILKKIKGMTPRLQKWEEEREEQKKLEEDAKKE